VDQHRVGFRSGPLLEAAGWLWHSTTSMYFWHCSNGPGRCGSNVSYRQFTMDRDASGGEARSSSALREHIDQLTHEAFELRRGLTQQATVFNRPQTMLCRKIRGAMDAASASHVRQPFQKH
jgi:hypothetical protein